MRTNERKALIANWLMTNSRHLPVRRWRLWSRYLAVRIAGTKRIRKLLPGPAIVERGEFFPLVHYSPSVFLVASDGRLREVRFLRLPSTMSGPEVSVWLSTKGLMPGSAQDLLEIAKQHQAKCPLGRMLALEPPDQPLAVWKGCRSDTNELVVNIFRGFGRLSRLSHREGDYVVAVAT